MITEAGRIIVMEHSVVWGFDAATLEFFRAVRDGRTTRSSFQTSAETMRVAREIEAVRP
ncbi:MAG TPA: hypothetical protein VFH83_10515 [Spirochaetia bacterium]|nr:hypothetical protein [Spirochaetia bacterium]